MFGLFRLAHSALRFVIALLEIRFHTQPANRCDPISRNSCSEEEIEFIQEKVSISRGTAKIVDYILKLRRNWSLHRRKLKKNWKLSKVWEEKSYLKKMNVG